jgi:hypothetical protein
MSLLQGPVVFIDDQLNEPTQTAAELMEVVRATGRPVAGYLEIPPLEHVAHWRSLAFLVLDWDLSHGSFGAQGSSTLSAYARSSLFDFLGEFLKLVFCPVFIVSAEDVVDIERQLEESGRFSSPAIRSRIKVFPKKTVASSFMTHLEEWVAESPSLSALSIWENEYDAAKNRLFVDLQELEPNWPVYVWQAATADKVDPSYELASVISANLLHRIDPVSFDIEVISHHPGPITGSAMRSVSFGRTTVPGARLHSTMLMPGDLFADESGEDTLWVNVSPACQTVLGRSAEPGETAVQVIRGVRQNLPTSKAAFEKWTKESNTSNQMLIHTVLREAAYVFDFRQARITTWSAISERRVGRLLPPYVSRLQQAHAAFLLTEGVPRVMWELYKPADDS